MAIEYEVRFLEINKDALIQKLRSVGAIDHGEVLLKETIFYDQTGTWQESGKLVRVRTKNNTDTVVTYKHHTKQAIDGAHETEFKVDNTKSVEEFLAKVGLVASRWQEKTRHTFTLHNTTIDIDTWPQVPTYVEIEGISEQEIRKTTETLGLIWEDAIYDDARDILETRYNIPIREITYFTFDKVE